MEYSFNILSVKDKQFSPHSIERLINKEHDATFTIGDSVTNEHGMRGKITHFELSDDLKDLYIYTDFSGIGMHYAMAERVKELPCEFQLFDQVYLNLKQFDYVYFGKGTGKMVKASLKANVIGVHFFSNKVKYDLSVLLFPKDGAEKEISTRLYNIDENHLNKNPQI